MIDEDFFKRYQKQILWFANTWIGRLYLCSNWDGKKIHWNWLKVDKFWDIKPSGATIWREFFYSCEECIKNENPDLQKSCIHTDKILCQRSKSKFWSGNMFAEKLARILFWMPYYKFETALKPVFAFSLMAFFWTHGFPFFFGAVDTFKSALNAADPFDGRVRLDPIGSVWNTERTKASGDGGDSTLTVEQVEVGKDASGNFNFKRVCFTYITGLAIPAADTINATNDTNLQVKRSSVAVSDGNNGAVALVQHKVPQDNDVAGVNFGVASGPPFPVAAGAMTKGATSKAMSGLTASTAFNWVLNADGRGYVARSGETKPAGAVSNNHTRLGFVEESDATDVAYAGGNSTKNSAEFFMRETAGAADQPVLSVDHSGVVTAVEHNLLFMGVG